MHGWYFLGLAIILEVAGTTCMKLSDGLTRLWPTLGIVLFYLASFACLTFALRYIDMSVAYAVWAGLGIALVSFIGVLFFAEVMTIWRAGCIALVLLGVVGLNLSRA